MSVPIGFAGDMGCSVGLIARWRAQAKGEVH